MIETRDNKKLYNKLTIIFFSAFGTTFFGAVLYSMNLSTIDKKNKIFGPILFAMLYNVFVPIGLRNLGLTEKSTFFPINILGGLILTLAFWKEQIEPDIKLKTRPIWIPLIIVLLIYGLFIGLNLYVRH